MAFSPDGSVKPIVLFTLSYTLEKNTLEKELVDTIISLGFYDTYVLFYKSNRSKESVLLIVSYTFIMPIADLSTTIDFVNTCGLHVILLWVALFIVFRYVLRDKIIDTVHQGIIRTLRSVYQKDLLNRMSTNLMYEGKDHIVSSQKRVMRELYIYLGVGGAICVLFIAMGATLVAMNGLEKSMDLSLLIGFVITLAYLGAMVGITYGVSKYIIDRVVLLSDLDQQLVIFEEINRMIQHRIENQQVM